MPKSCVAVNCTSHNLKKDKNVSFHVFPKAKERRDRWIQAVKRQNEDGSKWVPSTHAVLCGKHFLEGRPNPDPNHPDYIPSVFPHLPPSCSDPHKLNSKLRRFHSATKRKISQEKDTLQQTEYAECIDTTLQPDPSPPAKKTSAEHVTEQEGVQPMAKSVDVSEREMFHAEMDNLRRERDEARARVADLEKTLESVKLSAMCIAEDDEKSKFHTGLRWGIFFRTFQFLQTFVQVSFSKNQCTMPHIDQFFISLLKLRFGLPFEFLAQHTGQSHTTIIKVFWQWIDLIYSKLAFLIHNPDHDTAQTTLPSHFRTKFPRLTCIIDCFEIFVARPKNLKARAQTYSNYKKHTTVKFLIGCTPLGSVSFLSKGWGGRVSDIELIRKSSFIDPSRHRPGDQILADRGFTVQEDLAIHCGAHLIIPSFTKGKKQLAAQDVETSRKIASVRIHIERIIGLMKNRYAILQGTIPINVIKSAADEVQQSIDAKIDKLVTVCAILVNLGDGIIGSDTVH